jgi:hypothetical protein
MSRHEHLLLDGPDGKIEVFLDPHEAPAGIGLIAHPHPLFGGTADNKGQHAAHLTALEHVLAARGGMALDGRNGLPLTKDAAAMPLAREVRAYKLRGGGAVGGVGGEGGEGTGMPLPAEGAGRGLPLGRGASSRSEP